MPWFYEHLEFFVFGLFASGIALHFPVRRMERQRYLVLRNAYEDAVRDARESGGDPAAVVREAELQRAFMNSWLPGWFHGFGGCVVRWSKYAAVFTLVALFFKGPIMRGEEEYAKERARTDAAEKAATRKLARASAEAPRSRDR